MKVKISKAIEIFFPKPKFELVFFEAIANSIDAGATSISVKTDIDLSKGSTSIKLEISDDGCGFSDKNFSKFSKLLEVESDDHKGIGRLVFLNYFDEVRVSSTFGDKTRKFLYNKSFAGEHMDVARESREDETTLYFSGYNKGRLKSYDSIRPNNLRTAIIRHFFPLFYEKKLKKEDLEITLDQSLLTHEGQLEEQSASFNVSSLEELEKIEFSALTLDLLNNLEILYSIKEINDRTTVITSICSDGRAIDLNLLKPNHLPEGYELIFVVYSDFFSGKSDSSRQCLNLTDYEYKTLRNILIDKLSEILIKAIPEIKEHNKKVAHEFTKKYPHLGGYFDHNSVGLIERNRVIEEAQRKFFLAQREILEADELDQEKYEKSIEVSSRLLTEYILYRSLMIERLKSVSENDTEDVIHNAIVPMRKIFQASNLKDQVFFNNAWLLDDKFMNFRTILSDRELGDLARELQINDREFGDQKKRPDITIIFSSDPESSEKVDVVIVELKKLGLDLARKEEVVSQLRQRARKLVLHYPNKIQRMWFYGIVDFSKEFELSLLEDEFAKLYSAGNLFYKEYPVIPDYDNQSNFVPVSIFVLDFNAFIHDAESRNKTFLEILKSGFVDPNDDEKS